MTRHIRLRLSALLTVLCFSFAASITSTVGTTIGTCVQNFQEIYDSEALVVDPTVNRTYVICPNKLYKIGELDVNFDVAKNEDGGPPLPLRSNMHLKCGENGSRENLCYLTGGYLQVDGTRIREITGEWIQNVVVEGFVFVDASMYSFWGMKPGSVTFRDCEWRVRV